MKSKDQILLEQSYQKILNNSCQIIKEEEDRFQKFFQKRYIERMVDVESTIANIEKALGSPKEIKDEHTGDDMWIWDITDKKTNDTVELYTDAIPTKQRESTDYKNIINKKIDFYILGSKEYIVVEKLAPILKNKVVFRVWSPLAHNYGLNMLHIKHNHPSGTYFIKGDDFQGIHKLVNFLKLASERTS